MAARAAAVLSSCDSCTESASHDIDSRPMSRGSATAVIVKTSLAMSCLTVRRTFASETPSRWATVVNATRPSSCSARNTATSNAVSGSRSGGSAGTRGKRGIALTQGRQQLDAPVRAAVEEVDDGRPQDALAVLAAGVHAGRPPDALHAPRLVDVAVQRQHRAVALDRRPHRRAAGGDLLAHHGPRRRYARVELRALVDAGVERRDVGGEDRPPGVAQLGRHRLDALGERLLDDRLDRQEVVVAAGDVDRHAGLVHALGRAAHPVLDLPAALDLAALVD